MNDKRSALKAIYDAFETETAPYRKDAACAKGCAFCCTDAGGIHMTTLEGLVIRERIMQMPRPRQTSIIKALVADMKRRERNQSSICPLLMKNRACMIYDIRPFACRRIYSLKVCSPQQHPLLSRRVMSMGDDSIRALQALDDCGYSGHLSFILHMLDVPAFLRTYLDGEYRPEEIMAFGKAHGILINRLVGKARLSS